MKRTTTKISSRRTQTNDCKRRRHQNNGFAMTIENELRWRQENTEHQVQYYNDNVNIYDDLPTILQK